MKLFRHLAAVALLAVASVSQAAVTYGSNLVVNGGAESGIAGWSLYGDYSPVQSVDYGPNWVLPSQPGPADRGAKMFTGTSASEDQPDAAVGRQTLDFGTATTQAIGFEISGWLGGWQSQGDNAAFFVNFLDEFGDILGFAGIKPVLPEDRGNQTGLFYREFEGFMPIGTMKLDFYLSMERLSGGDNDGYADNLAFVLDAPAQIPEPGTSALMLLSLGVLGWMRKRAS
jgi:hypothetical protein